MLSLIILLPTLFACSPAVLAKQRDSRDQSSLAEAVGTYWQGVRWGDPEKMSPFLVAADDQLAVARLAATPAFRVTNTVLLQAAVDVEQVTPKDKPDVQVVRREGVVLVQVESFGANNRVTVENVEQRWYLDGRGWHVDVSRSPIDPDRPW